MSFRRNSDYGIPADVAVRLPHTYRKCFSKIAGNGRGWSSAHTRIHPPERVNCHLPTLPTKRATTTAPPAQPVAGTVIGTPLSQGGRPTPTTKKAGE